MMLGKEAVRTAEGEMKKNTVGRKSVIAGGQAN